MKNELKKEILLFVGMILGTFLVGGGLLVWTGQRIVREMGKIGADRVAFVQYSRTIELLADLKRAIPTVKNYQEKMNLLLPKKDDLVQFPRWVDGVSRVNKVSESSAFQGSTAAAQDQEAGSIGFTLDASGAASDIQNFFRELEFRSNQFLTSIDNFDLTEDAGTARVLARGRVFFR